MVVVISLLFITLVEGDDNDEDERAKGIGMTSLFSRRRLAGCCGRISVSADCLLSLPTSVEGKEQVSIEALLRGGGRGSSLVAESDMLLRNDSFSARRLGSSSCVSSCNIELAEGSSSSTSWMG